MKLKTALDKIALRIKDASKLIIDTTGSTGDPKQIKIDLKSRYNKCATIEGKEDSYNVGFFYDLETWACYSVLIYCLKNKFQPIHLKSFNDERIKSINQICLTPAQLMMLGHNQQVYNICTQVTIGGDYALQSHLDLGLKIFPNARITHVYASSETGGICSASDNLEGYPASKFKKFKVFEECIIINGEKLNDRWELKNGRYYFKGRTDCFVKVGGRKVYPELIEKNVIKNLSFVEDCIIYSKKAPLGGSMLYFEYTGIQNDAKVLEFFRKMEKIERPVCYDHVSEIKLVNGKKKRRR
jgi:hypothetical protein